VKVPVEGFGLAGGDGEVEGDGLGELDASGGTGGNLILIGAGWSGSDVGVASATAAGGTESDEGEKERAEEITGEVIFSAAIFLESGPEEEEGGGEEAESGFISK
jgi:hypothetical protein